MPLEPSELVSLLDLERLEDGLYRGRQPEHSRLARVYGGQVMAQALMAACRSVHESRFVHSLHAYFLLGGDPSIPIVYDVERIRDGGSFSTRRVAARQHGEVIFYMTASFHKTESGYEHQDAMPDVPSVDATAQMENLAGFSSEDAKFGWAEEWSALDMRYIGDNRDADDPDRALHPAKQQLWIRARGELPDDQVLHRCVLTYISDLTLLGSSLRPHAVGIDSPTIQSASLDHSMWFHHPVQAGAWHLYDQGSPAAVGARGLGTGRIFSQDGVLVATVAQEGLIRAVKKPV
ncbi:MAG: acyl-CoA thioesterase [Nocardioidaceae bacterium]|nr:acyl-CoA thioesterase [Nocardioidaceae bacterium]